MLSAKVAGEVVWAVSEWQAIAGSDCNGNSRSELPPSAYWISAHWDPHDSSWSQ